MCVHACAPLRVSNNEEEVGERLDCVCVCVEKEEEEEGGGAFTFKFCDICSLQLECVYFYTASHKQGAQLAPLVNVPALYNGKANEILTGKHTEERTKREKEEK